MNFNLKLREKLLKIRNAAIAKGMELLSEEEVLKTVKRRISDASEKELIIAVLESIDKTITSIEKRLDTIEEVVNCWNSPHKRVKPGDKCQYPGCENEATTLVYGNPDSNAYIHDIFLCCAEHEAVNSFLSWEPEYIEICPNCGCQMGIN